MDNDEFAYLLLYISNMLIPSQDGAEIKRLKSLLDSDFEIHDVNIIKKILDGY